MNAPGTELYSYDGFNRMIQAENGNGIHSYNYRPDGLRLSKTINGITTTHIWDGQSIALELDGSSNVVDSYIRGIGLIESDQNGWYLYNGHGDVVQLTNNTGAVTKEYEYDAFGNEKNIDVSDNNPYRYCGEYFDKETGTIYLRARYYDPVMGRFINEDTYEGSIDNPLSLNLYTYCYNNPIRYIDPTGHVVTEWDKKNCSKKQQRAIDKATKDYNDAKARGDAKGMADAHKAAEDARQKNRSKDEIGSASGYTLQSR